jgi:hypothetical protein
VFLGRVGRGRSAGACDTRSLRGLPGGSQAHPLPRWRLVSGKQGTSRPVVRAGRTPVSATANRGKIAAGCRVAPSSRSLGRRGSGRRILFVLLVVLLCVLAIVLIEEPNRPNVTGADPSLPYLVPSRTHGIAPRINRLTGG